MKSVLFGLKWNVCHCVTEPRGVYVCDGHQWQACAQCVGLGEGKDDRQNNGQYTL